MVRERLLAGDSDDQVRAALVARYGEYILLTPQATGSNLILWLAAPGLLLAGLGVALGAQRRRQPAAEAPLTPEEQARLDRILKS
jgi:cytochrome c-type biogenesis protein CcmH